MRSLPYTSTAGLVLFYPGRGAVWLHRFHFSEKPRYVYTFVFQNKLEVGPRYWAPAKIQFEGGTKKIGVVE